MVKGRKRWRSDTIIVMVSIVMPLSVESVVSWRSEKREIQLNVPHVGVHVAVLSFEFPFNWHELTQSNALKDFPLKGRALLFDGYFKVAPFLTHFVCPVKFTAIKLILSRVGQHWRLENWFLMITDGFGNGFCFKDWNVKI